MSNSVSDREDAGSSASDTQSDEPFVNSPPLVAYGRDHRFVALKEGQEHKDYHLYGSVWALQIWSYEMIPSLGDLCGIREKFVEVHRCLMWTTRKMLCDFTHFFDEKHKVFPSLPHLEEDEVEYYYLSFENGSPFDVQFIRPVQISVKTTEPASVSRKKAGDTVNKAAGKSIVQESAHKVSKRRRPSTPPVDDSAATSDREREPETERVCCVHGLPCPDHTEDSSRDEYFDRRLKAILYDESEMGFIARVSRRVLSGIVDYFGPMHRCPRRPEHSQHSEHQPSHHSERQSAHNSQRQISHHSQRQPSHHSERQPSHHSERHLSHHSQPQPSHYSERQPSHHSERPSHHSERQPSHHSQCQPSHHSERQHSHHSDRQASHHTEIHHSLEIVPFQQYATMFGSFQDEHHYPYLGLCLMW
ncbi:hypothetical protein OROMI_022834 [Orobanche minor]